MNKNLETKLAEISYLSTKLKKHLNEVSSLAAFFKKNEVKKKVLIEQEVLEHITLLEEEKQLITYFSSNYPETLKNIDNPPIILYYRGNISLIEQNILAIVGSRNPTIINEKFSADLSRYCKDNEIVTVSGLAQGIDSKVHKVSVKNTIAILGFGFNHIYPRFNKELLTEISAQGLVITEFFDITGPTKYNFPMRNRIIAALSKATVIIEAKESSGSLITSNFARDYGKTVFAVPSHPYDYRSAGCNRMINEGAILLQDFSQILQEYNFLTEGDLINDKKRASKKIDSLEKQEKLILNKLSTNGFEIQEIAEAINIDPEHLLEILGELELKDFIYRDMFGKIYRKFHN